MCQKRVGEMKRLVAMIEFTKNGSDKICLLKWRICAFSRFMLWQVDLYGGAVVNIVEVDYIYHAKGESWLFGAKEGVNMQGCFCCLKK